MKVTPLNITLPDFDACARDGLAVTIQYPPAQFNDFSSGLLPRSDKMVLRFLVE
jgi:hypothetical protein